MPESIRSAGDGHEDLDTKLPRTVLLTRGEIQVAFGLSRKEMDQLVRSKVFVAKYPLGPRTRARFMRSQVLAVVRTW